MPFIYKDESGPMRARRINAGVQFIAGPGHGFETVFLTLFAPWVEETITPVILEQLTQGLIENARNEAARLAFGMPAQLPPEVVLSVRRITITDTGVGGRGPGILRVGRARLVRPTPGRHLPKISTGSGGKLRGPGRSRAVAPEQRGHRWTALPARRDSIENAGGKRAVALLLPAQREMISLLATRPRLARKAAAIVKRIGARPASDRLCNPANQG
jgi:hypothetical protein